MSARSCQTFLWGGQGVSIRNDDGQYSCSCSDELWWDHNILGLPSCVPIKVHLIFGWIGSVLSLATLCHSAYHLQRQLKFHRQQPSASNVASEKCRRQFHMSATAAGALGIVYFAMVLEDELRWSLVVFSVLQMPVCYSCALLATRMWTYTNDPVLMRESPEVLAVCSWLETTVGNRVAHTTVSVAPIGALALTASGRDSVTAVKLVAGGVVALSVFIGVGFMVCGRSLLRAIDASLLLQHRRDSSVTQTTQKSDNRRRSSSTSGGRSDRSLSNARRKVRIVVIFAIVLCIKVASILLFAICTEYGAAAPLLMFLAPMTFVPPIWNVINIQLHAGRTQLRRRVWTLPTRLLCPRKRSSAAIPRDPDNMGEYTPSQLNHHQVVPTEIHSTSIS